MFCVDFLIIFPRDGDILKKICRCSIVLWYAVEHASVILNLSLSWMIENMAEFWKSKVWLVEILWETKEFVFSSLKIFFYVHRFFFVSFHSFLLCKIYHNLGNSCCKNLCRIGNCNILRWKRGSPVPVLPSVLTRPITFSICGKLEEHLSVCGWLRTATGLLKRREQDGTI